MYHYIYSDLLEYLIGRLLSIDNYFLFMKNEKLSCRCNNILYTM